ncbi:kelch repeat-containing protein [Ferrimicrobium sp.]|uniref:kelch repeat-containing protein n=1 Tax=Ferrimicrobium sp. TaxID=2926050 RepID=UPI002615E3A8|nr:kelch repeat-containing protein [Ferrimicrobium sp.]
MLVTGVRFSPVGGDNPITGERVWSQQNLSDTWMFGGENWQELRQSRYPSYAHQASAAQLRSGQVVTFGGIIAGPKTIIGVFFPREQRDSPLVDDTWIFDGENWQELDLKTRPAHRQFGVMASHPDEQGVLLFGGYGGEGNPRLLDDTWIFDGENWRELHPLMSPTPRQEACMTYDAMNGQVVLFGGRGDNGYLDDTWILALGE